MEKRSNSTNHLKPVPYQAIISYNEIQALRTKHLQMPSQHEQKIIEKDTNPLIQKNESLYFTEPFLNETIPKQKIKIPPLNLLKSNTTPVLIQQYSSHRSDISKKNPFLEEFYQKQNSLDSMQIDNNKSKNKLVFQKNFRVAPLNNYDEYLINDIDLKSLLQKGAQPGFSRWRDSNGDYIWKECQIISYDEKSQLFLIQFFNTQIKKKVNRLNLVMAEENLKVFNERYKLALERREIALEMQYVDDEINKKTENIVYKMSDEMMINICDKIFNRYHCSQEIKDNIISQVVGIYTKDITKFNCNYKPSLHIDNYYKNYLSSFLKKKNPHHKKTHQTYNLIETFIFETTEDLKSIDIDERFTIFHLKEFKKIVKILNEGINVEELFNSPNVPLFEKHKNIEIKEESSIGKNIYMINQIQKRNTLYPKELFIKEKFILNVFQIQCDKADLKNVAYPCSNKPINMYSKLMPNLIEFLKKVESIRLFRSFSSDKNLITLLDSNSFNILLDSFMNEANKIDRLIYKSEKFIDELSKDMISILLQEIKIKTYQKNQSPEFIKHFSSNELMRPITKLTNSIFESYLKICIKESFNSLKTNLEKYYTVLPLPQMSDKIEKALPSEFIEKRKFFRNKFGLSEEKVFEVNSTRKLIPSIEKFPYNRDKNIIFAIWITIIENIKNDHFLLFQHENLSKLNVTPQFQISLKIIKDKEKKEKVNKSLFKQRETIRRISREKIYQPEKYQKVLVNQLFSKKQEINIEEPLKYYQTIQKNFVLFNHFGWYDTNKYNLAFEPELHELESKFKEILRLPLQRIQTFDKIFSDSKKNEAYSIDELGPELLKFSEFLDEFLVWTFFTPLTIKAVLGQFSFLITQKKSYYDDIIEDFLSPKNNISIISSEYEALLKDESFIKKLPKTINCGFYLINITELKNDYLESISEFLNHFQSAFIQKISDLIESTSIMYNTLLQAIEQEPKTLENYIEIISFILSLEFKGKRTKMIEDIEALKLCINCHEKFLIELEESLLQISLEAFTWPSKISRYRKNSKMKLKLMKPKFMKVLEERKALLKDRFKDLHERSKLFENYYDLNQAFQICQIAREIVSGLKEVIANGKTFNEQERFLGYEISDFGEFEFSLENFEKFFLLWDFAEKWKFRSENWLSMEFSTLDSIEMEETLRDGSFLLQNLEGYLEENENILKMIRQMETEVNRVNELLYVIMMLKHQAFKTTHWMKLWEEMYHSLDRKPDVLMISLQEMLQDNLLSHSSLIYKIFINAKKEYSFEQEINRIENSSKEIYILFDNKKDPAEPDSKTYYYIVNGHNIIEILKDHISNCKTLANNSGLSHFLQERITHLRNFLLFTKKVLKILHELQVFILLYDPLFENKALERVLTHESLLDFLTMKKGFFLQTEALSKRNFLFFITLFEKQDFSKEIGEILTKELLLEHLQSLILHKNSLESSLLQLSRSFKAKHPRLSLLSEMEALKACSFINNPKEFLIEITSCFWGVKELEIEHKTSKTSSFVEIIGFLTQNNEKLFIKSPIKIDFSNNHELFFLEIMTSIEKALTEYIKNNIYKNLLSLSKNSLDYISLFKSLTNKQTCFQSLYLINDLLFFYELTHLMRICGKKDLNIENQLISLKNTLLSSFSAFRNFFQNQITYNISRNLQYSFINFSFQALSHINIIDFLLESHIKEIACFEYLIIPKFSLELPKNSLNTPLSELIDEVTLSNTKVLGPENENYSNNSSYYPFLMKTPQNELKIRLLALNYKASYSFEITPKFPEGFLLNTTHKALISLMSSLTSFSGSIFKGFSGIGKRKTLQMIGTLLAKPMYFIEMGHFNSISWVFQLIYNSAMGGFWLCFEHMERVSIDLLSLISQKLFFIRKALLLNEKKADLDLGLSLYVNKEAGFFGSFDLKEGLNDIGGFPQCLLDSFRVIDYYTPDIKRITHGYFVLFDFEEAFSNDFTEKFLLFLSFLDRKVLQCHYMVNGGLMKRDFNTFSKGNDLGKALSLSLGGIIRVLETCKGLFLEKTGLSKEVILWKALEGCLKGIIIGKSANLIGNLYSNIFNYRELKLSLETELSLNLIDNSENLMKKACNSFHLSLNKSLKTLFSTLFIVKQSKRPILLFGAPGTKKSLLIKLFAQYISLSNSKQFLLHWLKLDSIETSSLLGYFLDKKWNKGLLEGLLEDIAQGKDIIKEETMVFGKKEIPITEFFNYSSEIANKEEIGQRKSGLLDWIILDNGCLGGYYEFFLEMIGNKQVYQENGAKLRINEEISLFFEMENLSDLSIKTINSCSLVYINEGIFDLYEEFCNWIEKLCFQQPFYIKMEKMLKICYAYIYDEIMKELYKRKKDFINNNKQHEHFLLKNFISFLEILLNEFRKGLISTGDYDYSSEDRNQTINNIKLKKISHQEHSSNQPSNLSFDISYLETKYLVNIESIFLLSLLWSNLHFLPNSEDLNQLLSSKLHQYRKLLSFKFKTPNFGNNFFEILAQSSSFFDVFYDLLSEKWVLLSEFKLNSNKFISKELDSKVLSPQEIIRLNPKAIQLDEIQTQIENEKDAYNFLPHNLLFIETKHSKTSRYFLELFFAYERNFLLVSIGQNGKSVLIKELLRGKIEKNELKPICLSIDREIGLDKFQMLTERFLIKKGFGGSGPNSNGKGVIFIDDMNLANNKEKKPSAFGCLRQLIEHKGWFSANLGKYLSINSCFLGGAFSFSLSEEIRLFWTLEQLNLDNSFLDKMTIFQMPLMTETDLSMIFSSNLCNYFENDLEASKILDPLVDQFNTLAILFKKRHSSLSHSKTHNFGIFFSIELSKIITHYSFLYDSSQNRDLTLKTWIHLFDLVFDLNSLTKPFYNSLYNNDKPEEVTGEKSFSSISELSQESDSSSFKSSKGKALYSDGSSDEKNNERSNSEEEKPSLIPFIDEPSPLKVILPLLSPSKQPSNKSFESEDLLVAGSSPSTKAFQNKLKRREVIRGKVIDEFSIKNTVERPLKVSNQISPSKVFSTEDNHNKIQTQERLIKAKSSLLETNLKKDKSSKNKGILCNIIDLLCPGTKEQDIIKGFEQRGEFLYFNEEIPEIEEFGEVNYDEQGVLSLLTKKKKPVFMILMEKLKGFFKRNIKAALYLNAFSMNIGGVLTDIIRILEALQASDLNLLVKILGFINEKAEFMLNFCAETLNYRFIHLKNLSINEMQVFFTALLENILCNSQRTLCYIPINTPNLSLLKSFMAYGNLNLFFSKKQLKNLLLKYKNHAELEAFSFEQQLFILSNKIGTMLRVVLVVNSEILERFSTNLLKIDLKENSEGFFEGLKIELALKTEFSIENTNKIGFFHVIEAEFLHNFKEFHKYSLIQNPDFEKLLIKSLDSYIDILIKKRQKSYNSVYLTGKISDLIKGKEEKFLLENKELELKDKAFIKDLDFLKQEESPLKIANESIVKELDSIKLRLSIEEKKLKDIENQLNELFERESFDRIELLQVIKQFMGDYEEAFYENSFEKSEIFKGVARMIPIIFKNTFNTIGGPLKKDFDGLKTFPFDEIPVDLREKLAIRALSSQNRVFELFNAFDFQKDFPLSKFTVINEIIGSNIGYFAWKLSNPLQKALLDLINSIVAFSRLENNLIIEKTSIKTTIKTDIQEIDNLTRVFEVNSLKITRIPSLISELVQKQVNFSEIYQKSIKNKALLDNLFSNAKDLLNIALDQNFPFFSTEKLLEELKCSLILYIMYILKYPSFFRKSLLQKTEPFLIINREFRLLEYPFYLIFKDYPLDLFEKSPLGFTMLNIFCFIDILIDFDEINIILIDPNDFFLSFYTKLKGKSLVIEEITLDSFTESQITECIEQGLVLIVKNPNERLLNAVSPIFEWKFDKMINKTLRVWLEVPEVVENEANSICIFNKSMKVHPNFKIFLLLSTDELLKTSPSLIQKSLVLFYDIEDKSLWEQAFSQKFSYFFEPLERKAAWELVLQRNMTHFHINEDIYQDFYNELKKVNTIQEVSNKERLNSSFSVIKARFFEDYEKLLLKSAISNQQKKTGVNKDLKEFFKEIWLFIKKESLFRGLNSLEIKEKNIYQSLIDFIHIIKLTNIALIEVIGNLYTFTDALYLDLLEETLAFIWEKKLEVQGDKWKYRFIKEFFNRVISSLRKDHQNVFLFVFSFFYLKCSSQFNDFEWKIFIEGEIFTLFSENFFENPKSITKFKNIKEALSLDSSSSNDYILPLIPYNQKTFEVNFYKDYFKRLLDPLNNRVEPLDLEEDLLNQPLLVEKTEFSNPNPLPNRLYLQKRHTLVKQMLITPISTNNQENAIRKTSSLINTADSIKLSKKASKKDKNELNPKESSFSSLEELNLREEQDEFEVNSLISFNSDKKLKEIENSNSRVHFPINNNFLCNIEKESNSTLLPINSQKKLSNLHHNTKQIEHIFESSASPLEDLLTPRKSLVIKSFQPKTLSTNVNPNRKNLLKTSEGLLLEPWLQLTGWNSLENFLGLLPKNHEFQSIFTQLQSNPRPWKEVLFKSIKEYYPNGDLEGYPDFSLLYKGSFTALQTLVLMKFFRSDEIERLVRDFIYKAFPKVFIGIKGNVIEKVLRLKNIDRPIVFFYRRLNFDLNELVEMKASKSHNQNRVKRIIVSSFNLNEALFKVIGEALEEKNWVLIENLEELKGNHLDHFLKSLLKKIKSFEKVKLLLFYKEKAELYQPLTSVNGQESLYSFFSSCLKVYVQEESSIKEVLSSLFINEREEYKAHLQRKALSPLINLTSEKNLPSLHLLKNFSYEEHDKRLLRLKENSQAFNLHSFLDSKALLERNSKYLSMIEASQSKSVRFSLLFLYSLLYIRDLPYNKPLEVNFKEMRRLIEDLFQLLEVFTIEPLVFIEKGLSYMAFQGDVSRNSIFRGLFEEYIASSQEKQVILTIKNHQYELFKNISSVSLEENISKIIEKFPLEDHIELFGYHLNLEIQYNYQKAERIMCSLRKFDQLYNKSIKKEENLHVFIENTHSYKEFLSNQHKIYLKSSKKAYKLLEILTNLDFEQNFSIKMLLYTSIIDIFSEETLLFPREILTFAEDLLLDQPLVTSQQVYSWLSNEKPETPSKSPLIKGFSPSKLLKNSSVLFSPTLYSEKKAFHVKFELPQKNFPSLYRSVNKIIKNFEAEPGYRAKRKTIKLKIDENEGKKALNIGKDFMDDSVSLKKQEEKLISNEINEQVIKTVVLNEFLLMDSLKRLILNDMRDLKINLACIEPIQLTPRLKEVEDRLKNNKIPSEWGLEGNLYDFFKGLLVKLEYLQSIFKDSSLMKSSIVDLTRLFDPLGFIYYLLLDYSLEKKIPLAELKIVLKRHKKNEGADKGVLVYGFSLKGACISGSNYLEDEKIRDFNSDFPIIHLLITKKISKYSLQEKDSNISLEFYENNSFDIEGDYLEQMNNPLTNFEYQNKNITQNAKINDNKPKVYFVRVPISEVREEIRKEIPLKWFFYFKSYKTQEFWLKKGTKVCLDKFIK